jgi:hypothetical protein
MLTLKSINDVFLLLVIVNLAVVESSALSQLNNTLTHNVAKNIDHLKYSSLVYGLLVSTTEKDVSPTCYEHGQRIIQGLILKETWAMKGE